MPAGRRAPDRCRIHFTPVTQDADGVWLTVRCVYCGWGPVSANATRMKDHYQKKHCSSEGKKEESPQESAAATCPKTRQPSLRTFMDAPWTSEMQAKAERKLVYLLTTHAVPYAGVRSGPAT